MRSILLVLFALAALQIGDTLAATGKAAPNTPKKVPAKCVIKTCYGCGLNKYPQLRIVFNDYLETGYWANLGVNDLKYQNGIMPTAYFYDERDKEIGQMEIGNWNLERFEHEFKEEGFILKRPTLPTVKHDQYSEITLGGTTYRYYGKGRYYWEDAVRFASKQNAHGHQGRLLSIQCRSLENRLDSWIRAENTRKYGLQTDKSPIWLGASDSKKEGVWKWHYGDTFWDEQDLAEGRKPTGYSNWQPYEPNNGGHGKRNEHCAVYFPTVGWNDANCAVADAALIVEFGYIRSNELCVPPKPAMTAEILEAAKPAEPVPHAKTAEQQPAKPVEAEQPTKHDEPHGIVVVVPPPEPEKQPASEQPPQQVAPAQEKAETVEL